MLMLLQVYGYNIMKKTAV